MRSLKGMWGEDRCGGEFGPVVRHYLEDLWLSSYGNNSTKGGMECARVRARAKRKGMR